MISVLNVTNKPGGIDILKDNLEKQTYQDFELIIVDALYDWRKDEVAEYFKDVTFPVKHIPEPPFRPGDVWNLNKAYNEGLRHAEGELVISLQDYIWIKGTALEQFVDLSESYGLQVAISGIGHKALFPDHADNLQGKISIWNEPFTGVPSGVSEADHRLDGKQIVEDIPFSLFELNFACVPLEAYKAVGGFDEEYDKGYSCDNFNLSFRLSLLDYKFLLDKTNECIGFNQKDLFPRPKDWEKLHNRYVRHPEAIRAILEKRAPYKLEYLK